jgi:Dna[CI] antecedent, DciA
MQSARHSLQSLAARVLKNAPPDEAVVLAWPLACGSAVAERTSAVAFENGTLRVRVPDRGWQCQLESFSPQYAQKIAQISGIAVTAIRYEVARGQSTRQS